MTDISLRQLESFIAVADYGSFSRAAEELFLSQSTVSAHISALEELLGARLIVRGERKKIHPSNEGEKVYPIAKKIMADCQSLTELFDDGKVGPLSLGASTVPGQYLVPKMLSAFLEMHPAVHYELRHGDSSQMHQLLKKGEIRLGFVGAKLEPEAFKYIPLAEDRLVMVTQNNMRYSEKLRSGIWGWELLYEPMIVRKDGSGTYYTLQKYIGTVGVFKNKLNLIAHVDDPESIKRMVIQGVGVSVLSEQAVREEVENGSLLAFEMDENGLKRDIFLAYNRDAELSRTERSFVQFLKNHRAAE